MWIIPKQISCHFAPVLEGWTLESALQSQDPSLFVVLSGKATPQPYSWRGWKTRPWSRALFGAGILESSTAARGVEKWILSLRGIRVSHFHAPANGLGRLMIDGFGETFTGLCAKYSQTSAFSRMYQDTFDWATPTLSEISNKRVMRLRVDSLARRKLGHLIAGNGCSSSGWTTPKSHQRGDCPSERERQTPSLESQGANWATPRSGEDRGGNYQRDGGKKEGMARPTLTGQVKQWMTPVANDDNKSPEAHLAMKTRMKGGPRAEITSLQVQAKHWATPRASAKENYATKNAPSHGVTHGFTLAGQAGSWQTPASDSFRSRGGDRKDEQGLDQQARFHPAQTTPKDGLESKRVLNPRFVEWLMGWPIAWTGCDVLEMASFQSWRRKHLSVLRRSLQQELTRR